MAENGHDLRCDWSVCFPPIKWKVMGFLFSHLSNLSLSTTKLQWQSYTNISHILLYRLCYNKRTPILVCLCILLYTYIKHFSSVCILHQHTCFLTYVLLYERRRAGFVLLTTESLADGRWPHTICWWNKWMFKKRERTEYI